MNILPEKIIKSEIIDPKKLVIFSKVKTGKTLAISLLPNCLLLDFEDGSDYVDALKVKIIGISLPKNEDPEDYKERVKNNKFYLAEIGQAIRDAGFPYDFIAIDTLSGLENMAKSYAEDLYSRSPVGKYWFVQNPNNPDNTPGKEKYGSILALPEASGYYWLRESVEKILNFIYPLAPKTIILGHSRDNKANLDKTDTSFSSDNLDAIGQVRKIIAQSSDAIAYMSRKGKKAILSFKSSDTISCGSRPKHLNNIDVVITEQNEMGEIVSHWEEVYKELKK